MKSATRPQLFKKILRRGIITFLSIFVILQFATYFFSLPVKETVNVSAPEAIQLLEKADKITIAKKGKEDWRIIADNKDIARIKENSVKNDEVKYILSSNSGALIQSSKEDHFIYNNNGKLQNVIVPKLAALFTEYEILDSHKRIKGKANEKISRSMRFEIVGDKETKDFTIQKSYFYVGKKITIIQKNKESSVSPLDAIWLSVLAEKSSSEK